MKFHAGNNTTRGNNCKLAEGIFRSGVLRKSFTVRVVGAGTSCLGSCGSRIPWKTAVGWALSNLMEAV